jgi:hypothetical protein
VAVKSRNPDFSFGGSKIGGLFEHACNKNTGYKDDERYKTGLLQIWNNVTDSRVNLHRAYLSETGLQCQACKHEACMSG